MEDEPKHYPPGAEPEKPAEEPKPEAKAPEHGDQPEAPKPEEKKPAPGDQEKAPEAEKPKDNEPEPKPATDLPKKRSIYDDYKDEKKEAQGWKATAMSALKAQGVPVKGTETLTELQALLDKKDEAKSPAAKAAVDDEIEAFAQEEGLKPESLTKLTEIILKRVPKAEAPAGLSKEEMDEWRADRATRQREAEDRAIEAAAPTVREQMKTLGFEIHNDADATAVIAEIKRLAHTDRYHDKEVDYIVFRERAALSKLVSPKKPSFESGSQGNAEAAIDNVDFSKGSVTPQQAQKATQGGNRSTYEIRSAK